MPTPAAPGEVRSLVITPVGEAGGSRAPARLLVRVRVRPGQWDEVTVVRVRARAQLKVGIRVRVGSPVPA